MSTVLERVRARLSESGAEGDEWMACRPSDLRALLAVAEWAREPMEVGYIGESIKECRLCTGTWDRSAPEVHEPDCPIPALTRSEP